MLSFFIYNNLMKLHKKQLKKDVSIDDFVDRNIKLLTKKYKGSKILWRIFSMLIAIINVLILGICIYLLYILLTTYYKNSNNISLFKAIGPQIFIVCATILLFPLTFITVIYSARMKAAKYKEALKSIHYISMQYSYNIDRYSSNDKDIVYKQDISKIVKNINSHKHNKPSYKKALKRSFLGNDS